MKLSRYLLAFAFALILGEIGIFVAILWHSPVIWLAFTLASCCIIILLDTVHFKAKRAN